MYYLSKDLSMLGSVREWVRGGRENDFSPPMMQEDVGGVRALAMRAMLPSTSVPPNQLPPTLRR